MGLRVDLKAGLHSCSTIQVPGGWGVVIVSAPRPNHQWPFVWLRPLIVWGCDSTPSTVVANKSLRQNALDHPGDASVMIDATLVYDIDFYVYQDILTKKYGHGVVASA